MLIRYIIDRNNYQVGQSGLYLNPYQPDPFRACYKVRKGGVVQGAAKVQCQVIFL